MLSPHVDVLLATGDVTGARAAADELAEIAGDARTPFLVAASAHADGAVRLAEGDARAALAALRRAWVAWRDIDVPYEAMAAYQADRDERSLPMYEYTCQLATLEPPPPDLAWLFTAVSGDQDAMDEFARLNAGVVSPAGFFAPDNVARLVHAADDPT